MAETYHIMLTRKNDKKEFYVSPCTGEYIRSLVNKTFKGRFTRPEKLRTTDGVKLIVSTCGKVFMGRRIYNKSVSQVHVSLVKAIHNTPI